MPTPTEQMLSRTYYVGDGITTTWNFAFSGGYIDKAHVKAYTLAPNGDRVDLTVTSGNFIGPYQLTLTPPVASGHTLLIYRDTPTDQPLVDFTDGSNITEAALDTLARQAVMCAAENEDALNYAVGPQIYAIADQVAADAASAAASANSAINAAASAANDTILLLGPTLAHIDSVNLAASSSAASAATSASNAAASAVSAGASEVAVATIAGAFTGTFGFSAGAYDFGSVADPITYLDLDLGTLT